MSETTCTIIAPANIAMVKYWGARDLSEAIPNHASISMTLDRCHTECSVAYRATRGADEVALVDDDGRPLAMPDSFVPRVVAHLDVLRETAGVDGSFRVATRNSFPSGAGMASSASGFAALTMAAAGALGLDLDVAKLSDLARRSGSGSAARSVLGGYVEWPIATGNGAYAAAPLADASDWDLRDVIALIDVEPKKVSSLAGHERASTSPHYATRLGLVEDRLRGVRAAIAARDLDSLGTIVEQDAIELHVIAMTSRPPIFYWRPATLAALAAVRALRRDGVPAYSTIDAGANVHVLCDPSEEDAVAARLSGVPGVVDVIRDRVGSGPRRSERHLIP